MFRHSQHRFVLCALLSLSGLAASVPAAETPAAPEVGVWQKHELSFLYQGFTTIYSCDGLADRLKELLIQSGARADAKVRAGACARSNGPDRFASAQLVFYSLGPQTSASASADAVPATWHRVKFVKSNRRTGLEAGECELIEQFRDLVVKKAFTTRGLESETPCYPHQISNATLRLEFEVLAAVQ